MHVLKYAGVLAAAHKWRALVVPPLPVEDTEDKTDSAKAHADAHAEDAERERPATHRSQYRPWAELMRRTFKIEVDKCERCGSRMKLRAFVIADASIERFLRHIGEPTEPPTLAPARGPPFFKSRVLRKKLGELDAVAHDQKEMFIA
jgi:hypothetical protein